MAHSIKLDDAVKDNDDSASTDEKTSVSEDSNVELEQSNTDNIKPVDAATESAGDDVQLIQMQSQLQSGLGLGTGIGVNT